MTPLGTWAVVRRNDQQKRIGSGTLAHLTKYGIAQVEVDTDPTQWKRGKVVVIGKPMPWKTQREDRARGLRSTATTATKTALGTDVRTVPYHCVPSALTKVCDAHATTPDG